MMGDEEVGQRENSRLSESTPWLSYTRSHRYALRNDYDFLNIIGRGSFGTVFSAQHTRTGLLVAVKVLKWEAKELRKPVRVEVEILKKLRHSNIVKLFEVAETSRFIYIVQEQVLGKTLWEYVQELYNYEVREKQVRLIFREVLTAIMYCHNEGIVHGDLKPDNIITDIHGHVKIIDFGLGLRFLPGQEVTVTGGTLHYLAPEVLLRRRYKGPPIDVWALGVTLYEILCDERPFEGNTEDLTAQITSGSYVYPAFLSGHVKDLIKSLLNFDPDMRPTVQDVLCHPWVLAVPPPICASQQLSDVTVLAIETLMAAMGFKLNHLKNSIREKKFNHAMATYLLLEEQALRGLGKPLPQEQDEDGKAEEIPSSSSNPAPTMAASEPTLGTGPSPSKVKSQVQQVSTGSQLPITAHRSCTAKESILPSPGEPSLTGPLGTEGPSLTSPRGPEGPSLTGPCRPEGPSLTGPRGPEGPSLTGPCRPKGPRLTGPRDPEGPSLTGPRGPEGPSLTGPRRPKGPSLTGPRRPKGPSLTGPRRPKGPKLTGPCGPEGPSLTSPLSPEGPSLTGPPARDSTNTTSASPSHGSRVWKRTKKRLVGCLRGLCCWSPRQEDE